MPRLTDFRARLANVPDDATPADLQSLATELVERCSGEAYPKKSVAAALRHARKDARESTVSLLGELVEGLLAEQQENNEPVAAPGVEGFIGLGEASRRLKISVRALKERLRDVKFRRLYGWPWWDAHQWWFSPAALDPIQRAAYMAQLPFDEPATYQAMLPPWCQRAENDT
jgi:hypothetical protein